MKYWKAINVVWFGVSNESEIIDYGVGTIIVHCSMYVLVVGNGNKKERDTKNITFVLFFFSE